MKWREKRELVRGRLVQKYDAQEAKSYEGYLGTLSADDETAYLTDIQLACSLTSGQCVLDVGAGTGALTKLLTRVEGLEITALEPSPSMCALLRAKPELVNVKVVESECDRDRDGQLFDRSSFDAIVCRQVVNSLFDPLVAFRNWLNWLKPSGHLIVIEGVYGRDGWMGIWQEEVDAIPLSACQSLATLPYLLESVGFQVESADWMHQTNCLPSTRTKRYLVVAVKPALG